MRILILVCALAVNVIISETTLAQSTGHEGHQMPAPTDHSGHDMGIMNGVESQPTGNHQGHAMPAAFGPYAMTREASGTSWQPDTSPHMGVMAMTGDWTLMGHSVLNLVHSTQSGPRGANKTFVSGMIMGMATGALSDRDTVQVRAMLSPDPFMGRSGYPLLLAAGETANGVRPLIDRQHPHDLFMELSASYSRKIGDRGSIFAYFGLPGEPAFGPPAFMHRASIMDSPEAPITHHWLDSTHIAFGVITAGVTWGPIKAEVSRFKGREPNQSRYDIETPKFDSTAIRLSWNPSPEWALQASWARQISPEQLEPDEDQEKWSASAIWTRPINDNGYIAMTAAWGRKTSIEPGGGHDHALNAFVLEATIKPNERWTLFVRGEMIDTDELYAPPGQIHGDPYRVGKMSFGTIHDWRATQSVKLGLGALIARSVTPVALDPLYGGDRTSGMVYARLKLGS